MVFWMVCLRKNFWWEKLNYKQVIEMIGEEKWNLFLQWIEHNNKTVGLYDNGMIDYHESDVKKFYKKYCQVVEDG